MGNAAKVGDIGTDHDGFPPTKIISGSADVFIDGLPAARLGDPLEPHDKPNNPPHPRFIAAGSSTVLVNGQPLAFTGKGVSCGGVIIGGGTVTVGDGAPSARAAAIAPPPSPVEIPASSPGFWPPYNPLTGEYLDVVYTQSAQTVAVLTFEELQELWKELNAKDNLGDAKSIKDAGERIRLAQSTAKALGGMGVIAYTKVINGEPYTIIKNYKQVHKTIPGNIWKASNPKILRLGIGAKANAHLVKMGFLADFVFSVSINVIDYILKDEVTMVDLFSNVGVDLVKGTLANGVGIIAAGVVATVFGPGILLTGTVFALATIVAGKLIDFADEEAELSEMMKQAVKAKFE